MSKISIPSQAMKLAMNVHSGNWNENLNKFCRVLKEEYPYMTYDQCVDKFSKIQKRKHSTVFKLDSLKHYKHDIEKAYNRYKNYKDFKDTDNMNTCIDFYEGVSKKGYDRVVDELGEMGMSYPYAPQNMDDIPRFLSQEQRENNFELVLTQIVVTVVLVGLLVWSFYYGINN